MSDEVPLRFLKEVGTIANIYAYWKKPEGCDGIQPLYCSATREFMRSDVIKDETLGGDDERAPLDNLPNVCKRCGSARPDDVTDRKIFREALRTAPDGSVVQEPVPGDCYYLNHDRTVCAWDNCDGAHLVVVCPDGTHWDTSSRANNCDRRDDKTHRCWVLRGDPRKGELPTVAKDGDTCSAGAGSIATPGYHGFLTNGVLRKC